MGGLDGREPYPKKLLVASRNLCSGLGAGSGGGAGGTLPEVVKGAEEPRRELVPLMVAGGRSSSDFSRHRSLSHGHAMAVERPR